MLNEAAFNTSLQMPKVLVFCLFWTAALLGQQVPHQATVYAQDADSSLRRQDLDAAISDYVKALKIAPAYAAAWNNLGSAWFAKKQYLNASDSFRRAARLEPQNADYQFNAALATTLSDQCDAAAPFLRKSLDSPNYRARVQFLMGVCAFIHEQWEPAKVDLKQAEGNGVTSAEVYYMLTIASRKTKDPENAKAAFSLLREKYPDSPLLHELLGDALDRADQDNQAIREIGLAISSRPDEPGLHAQLGFLFWKSHNLLDAKAAFEQELILDKHSYSAMRYLGDIAEQTNQFDNALEWYARALQERPESGEAHFSVGRLLAETAHHKEALKELQACFPAMDQDATAQYWIARELEKLGRPQEAREHMAKVREINDATRQSLLDKLGQATQSHP
jgi:tetratricopeptide (TPR) repeat protein